MRIVYDLSIPLWPRRQAKLLSYVAQIRRRVVPELVNLYLPAPMRQIRWFHRRGLLCRILAPFVSYPHPRLLQHQAVLEVGQ